MRVSTIVKSASHSLWKRAPSVSHSCSSLKEIVIVIVIVIVCWLGAKRWLAIPSLWYREKWQQHVILDRTRGSFDLERVRERVRDGGTVRRRQGVRV